MDRLLQAVIPVLVTFGPVFMVIDQAGPYRWIGACMLASGIALMYRVQVLLLRELKQRQAAQPHDSA